ncbi:MAG: hypothetical protein GKR96_14770 [Gammaproteobacteria bacterium]|nr:hypothetical protein [Gammaproteobacteria bacterium]
MIEIETTESVIGARVRNVSLGQIPDLDTVKEIDIALERYGVLIFPEQDITPRQMINFSSALGDLELTELEAARLPDFKEIFVVGNVGKGLVSFSPANEEQELEWHSDHIHHEIAARASLLYAKEVPDVGGDTLFACMYYAYDGLTVAEQQTCRKLEMIHSASGLDHYLEKQKLGDSNSLSGNRKHKEVVRPLVREHPETGRRGLYFGNQVTIGIVGWDDAEAGEFIRHLTKHACQEAFQYRHQWSAQDAVLWDNRRVLHAGTPYDVENTRRLMHRTTIRETAPITLIDE